MSVEVREGVPGDRAAVQSLYRHAFPDEDLLPLVHELLDQAAVVMSLAASIDTRLVGHGLFTRCGVAGTDAGVALLGPLAVEPARQGLGIGSAIVRDGLRRLEAEGASQVFVLGDPAYYGRFGFVPELAVNPPYELPAEWAGAWQSLRLGGATTVGQGTLSLPPVWLDPSLWSP